MSAAGDAVPTFRSLLWLSVAMSLCCLPFLEHLPLWLLPMLAALGWWRLDRARRGHSAPSGSLRGLAAVIVAGSLILTGSIGFGLESAIPLYIAFLWLKLLEVKDERDLFMAGYLTCFLAGAGVLLDQGLGRTIFACAALLLVTAACLGHHLGSGRNRQALLYAIRRAGLLLLQGAPAAAVLFLLIPRPQMPFTVERGQGTSGISDKLRPGDFDRIALSQEVAFRVTFPFNQDPPEASGLFWRGLVLTGTDGIGWYREPHRALWTNPRAETPTNAESWLVQEITLLPHLHNWLYALDPPVNWSPGLQLTAGTVLMRERPVTSPLTYRVSSDLSRSATDGSPMTRNVCLALPDQLDARLGLLANAWRDAAGGIDASAADIAAAGLRWFRDQGFTYSLEPGAMAGDPTATFLFERRSGFCSHYSSAFALLMRLVRVPARVVVGYHGGEWNDLGDFLMVRQAHAHAWCEIWEEREQRWLRIDPTSAVVVGDQATQLASEGGASVAGGGGSWSLLRGPRKFWDYIDTTWENWMFRYDGSAPLAFAEQIGLGAWAGVAVVIAGIAAGMVCLVVAWWLIRRWGRRSDPVLRLYQRWCARLARSGCARRPDEAPLAFADRAMAALPARADEIRAVTDAYCRARYAENDPSALDRLRAALRATGAGSAPR